MAKKIFFVINSLEGGGAERVISNLSNSFSKKNYKVSILCLNTAAVKYEVDEHINIINLVKRKSNTNTLNRIKYAWLTFYRLLKILHKEKPACTISFMTSANLYSGFCCLLLGLPYLVSERTTPDDTINKYNRFFQWFSFTVYRKAKAIVLPARGMGVGFKRNMLFQRLQNFTTINNPIHAFKRPSYQMVHSERFILAVGRLDYQKGFDILIDAYDKLGLKNVALLISGEGPERKNLESQIAALGLQHRVLLIGFKSNLQDYYAQAELFVLSSRNEGYPNALVEAMGSGCACVAVDCEFGPSEIIEHNVNGILVKHGDTQALSLAIAKLLDSKSLKAKFSNNAKQINHTNSIEQITLNWENLIFS
ncbi:glycosyltransferase family 4 protein [Pedobacter sandarakinus]|uniref:glycosyltransferase family 4 protein n=1 Tax=Pedobacter sandarakinus TaxID=353156 RepID=UPI002247BBCD|nr:glycosyltransferase family 4 protein [Pedobacter sandarakinus]MCX2574299.1 glycosyltransferase family 4 protein [Pedobacter sandarakinus]